VIMAAAAADDSVQEQGDPANVLQPAGTGPDIAQGKGLTVTAATFADQRASFAGNGTEISIAAYGAFSDTQGQGPPGIFGAFPANSTDLEAGSLIPLQPPCGCRTTFQGDSRYAYLMGTSMATPMVTAVAALVRHFNPDLTAAEVIGLLKTTARRPAGTGWSPDLGWGILDAGAALAGARGIDRHPPTSRLRAPAHVRRRSFLVRWTGSDPAPPGVVSSGIAEYEVWRSARGGRPRRIARTRKTDLRVRGKPGSLYGFFTIAIDRAGNREPAPLTPDARVRVLRGAR
jgi:serine protease